MPLRGRSVKLDETLSRCQIKCEEDEKKTNVETYTKASIEYFSIRFPGYLCGETFFFSSPSHCYLHFSIWFHGKWKFKFRERERNHKQNRIDLFFFLRLLLLRMIDFEYYY